MRKFIFILVTFLAAALIYLSFGEIETIVETIEKGNIGFILLALITQCVWFLGLGFTYASIYRILELNTSIYRLSLMAVASNFVNTIAPTAGVGGMAVFISDAKRNNQPTGKVTVAGMLFVFFDYLAFLVILTLGLIVLFRRNDLDLTEIITSAIMFAMATTLGILLYLGARSADALGNALAWMARLVNRIVQPFTRREMFNEDRARKFAHEMSADLKSLPQHSHNLIQPLLLALLNKTLSMGVLMTCFLAFQVPFSPGTIIGGYAISYLFLIVSFTPAGIGIVDGVMPLTLASLRVEWSQAVIITLAYRGITFWFPLGVGAIAFRILNREK